jgi:hypothetical protein
MIADSYEGAFDVWNTDTSKPFETSILWYIIIGNSIIDFYNILIYKIF